MLSGGAVRELVWMLLDASGIDPAPYVGHVRNRAYRYKAIRELEDAGLIQVERLPGRASRLALRNKSFISLFIATRNLGQPVEETATPPVPVADTRIQNWNTSKLVHVEETGTPYDSLLDEAYALDHLPDDGKDTPSIAGTPFRQRRIKQREYVQRIWAEFFPKLPALSDANANEFLRLCDDLAELVYEMFEKLQTNPKVCFAYVRAAMRNAKQKRAEEPRTEGTISPASGSVNYPGWDSDDEYHAWQKRSEEAQALAKQMGYDDGDE